MGDIVDMAREASQKVFLDRDYANELLLECVAEIERVRHGLVGYAKLYGARIEELENQLSARDAEIERLREGTAC